MYSIWVYRKKEWHFHDRYVSFGEVIYARENDGELIGLNNHEIQVGFGEGLLDLPREMYLDWKNRMMELSISAGLTITEVFN